MAKFEAHITLERDAIGMARHFAKEFPTWKVSAFDSDPVMEDKPYCYLTSYNEDEEFLLTDTNYLANLIAETGCSVLRQKIERIIYDTKTNVNEIEASRIIKIIG